MWYIYTQEYYKAIEKDEIMSFESTWVVLQAIMLNEISQTEKDKYHDSTHMWNLKTSTYKKLNQNYKSRDAWVAESVKRLLSERVMIPGSWH